jgi:hypothetical protein
MPGQFFQLGITFGIIPPILTAWCQRTGSFPLEVRPLIPSFLAAVIILIGVGAINFVAYYLSFYIISALWLVFGFILLSEFRQATQAGKQVKNREAKRAPVTIDPWVTLQNFILIAAFAVFGFSMLDDYTINFQLLVEFGLGFGIFLLLIAVIPLENGTNLERAVPRLIRSADLLAFVGLIAATATGWFFVTTGVTLEEDATISPIVIGLAFGSICIRILLASRGFAMPPARHAIIVPRVTNRGMSSFAMSLGIVLCLGIGIISIQAQSEAGGFAFLLGLVLSAVGLVLVTLRAIKNKGLARVYENNFTC